MGMIRFFRKKSSKNQTFGKSLVKVDCVIVAVAHDDFKQMKFKDFLLAQTFSLSPFRACGDVGRAHERKALLKELYSFLAQVLSRRKKVFFEKKKCVDVRGIFDEEEAKEKGFYYKRL
jgi:hypothetical protein